MKSSQREIKSSAKEIYTYDGLSARFHNRYECCFSLDGITNFQIIMTITNSLTIALTLVRSSVRIPHSIHNFKI